MIPVDEFRRSFQRAIDALKEASTHVSPREMLFLKLGLHASHLEEAIAQGETGRAQTHFNDMIGIVQKLQL